MLQVEDAASLCGKKEALQEERQRLQQLIEKEEAAAVADGTAGAGSGGGAPAAEGREHQDSLDAFMTGKGPAQRGLLPGLFLMEHLQEPSRNPFLGALL